MSRVRREGQAPEAKAAANAAAPMADAHTFPRSKCCRRGKRGGKEGGWTTSALLPSSSPSSLLSSLPPSLPFSNSLAKATRPGAYSRLRDRSREVKPSHAPDSNATRREEKPIGPIWQLARCSMTRCEEEEEGC